MTTTFKMPKPDSFDSQMRQETYYKDTLVEALCDVLEQAASFCEQNQVSIGRATRGFMEFDKECGGMHQGMDYAKVIRAMREQIE